MSENVFLKHEIKFMVGVSSALGLRQLGLMLVVPFISLYGKTLEGNTPFLIGLSLGIYGLAQGCFQIPYGMISDKIGRKPIVLLGLMQLIVGMVLASYADNIFLFILARALQGSGAINAAALSWVGDSIEINKSNKAMGIISSVIGGATALSLTAGTVLKRFLSVPQIFLICAILASFSWFYIMVVMKDKSRNLVVKENGMEKNQKYILKDILANSILLRLYGVGFIMNFVLMGMFYITPQLLEVFVGEERLWMVFVPAIIIAILALKVVNKFADKGMIGMMQTLSFGGVFLGIATLFSNNSIIISLGNIIFFSSFICLNALLTSCINISADRRCRGMVNGISNTIQFIGSFFGATLTGALWGSKQHVAVLLLLLLSVLGIAIALSYRGYAFHANKDEDQVAQDRGR